jgi:hypothetical protein
MDVLAFIAKLVGSLAWPAAVILIVFMCRRALAHLIPGLQRIKYKDIEVEFGRQLAEARGELSPVLSAKSLPEPQADKKALPQAPTSRARYFQSLAEVSPLAAILEAWLGFELAANAAVEFLGLTRDGRPLSMQGLLAVLHQQELITSPELDALTRLRALRNNVVHGPEPDLSTDLIAEYATLLGRITEDMQNRLAKRQKGGLTPA